MTKLHEVGVGELAQRITRREVSPAEVVEACIARIEAVNPRINAVVTTAFERARREARDATERTARREPLGPLHGVPFTAKDALDTEDVRSTGGLLSRRERVPRRDAHVVAQVRSAGGILLGKTNLAENCWSGVTDNILFGRTNNPWNLERTVGGSSGGSAALVAACGAPMDLGSDLAGSIRLPAFFTGVVGFRPTSGTVPEDGMCPPSVGRIAHLDSLGPLTRRVSDAALVFDVLLGVPPAPLDVASLRGASVASWYGDASATADPEIRGSIDAAVAALRDAGMVAVQGAPGARHGALIGWTAYLEEPELRAVSETFGGGPAWSPLGELARGLVGSRRVAAPSLFAWISSHYGAPVARRLVDAGRWRSRLRGEMLALVGRKGVAVCPVRPAPAPDHAAATSLLSTARVSGLHAWVNLAGLPAVSVPTGVSRDGLPIGLQIVGNAGGDRTVLEAALVVERALSPTWRGPPEPG